MAKYLLKGAIFLYAFVVGILVWQFLVKDDLDLPKESSTENVPIGTEVNLNPESSAKIMITEGIKHSIPLEEIQTLLGKDGIPSIDKPKFETANDASVWLGDNEPGIALSLSGVNRFYPYNILTWHEIVNDDVNGKKVLITYCPLCLTGYAIDPLVQGEGVEFGTSGKLWNSNLIMYDRKTNSLWSQVLAEAIVGEMTGAKLNLIPTDQMRFGNWKKAYPNGQVLSKNTGFSRNYSAYPYAGGDYFSVDDLSLRLVSAKDARLPNDAFVFGVVVNDKAKAYSVDSIKKSGEITDNFQNITFVLRHNKELDTVQMFQVSEDGSEERISPISGFWFAWAAAHPKTDLHK